MLTDAQIERYARQLLLPEIGGAGQERLLASRVVLEGEGVGLEFCRAYLIAAGVGQVSCGAGAPARLSVHSDSSAVGASWSSTEVAVARGACPSCIEESLQLPATTSVLAVASASVAGTLLATEAVEVLLGRKSLEAQALRLDLASGKPSRTPLSLCTQCRRTQ